MAKQTQTNNMDNKPYHNHLLISFNPKELLHNRLFYPITGQILFEHNGQLVITNILEDKDYTVSDYLQLPENAPYQLINGKLIFMAAPGTNHQLVLQKLNRYIDNYVFSNNLGNIFVAPTDVLFDNENVIQPDILFVSIKRKEIIHEARITGAPEFVVEILSPGTEKYDRNNKLSIFGKHGVEECWLVSLKNENIEVYQNQNHQMVLVQTAQKSDSINSKVIKGFELHVNAIFE